MQTPQFAIGELLYLALPACLAATVPDHLAAWAEWSVTCYIGDDDWTETQTGWLCPRLPVPAPKGHGRIACFDAAGGYLCQVRSSRQGLRLVAQAAHDGLLPQMIAKREYSPRRYLRR